MFIKNALAAASVSLLAFMPATIVSPSAVPQASYSADLQPCVDAALKQGAQQWTCDGAGLGVEMDQHGKKVSKFTSMPVPPRKSKPLVRSGGTFASPMKGGDFLDTWCETGSICTRKINSYTYEVKGNAAYGNQNGAIGSYDVVVRTYLNGRQAQWTVTRNWDSGPSLRFTSSVMRCWEDRAFLADINCGQHNLSDITISSSSYRNTQKSTVTSW